MGYDVIGDIHGHAVVLTALLGRMGYRERAGTWRHASRQAIFIVDFIDRGPQQVETVRIVRAMVEACAALAVMGNHEFNAIAWHTEDQATPGEHLRARTEKNYHQHQAFLAETADRPELRESIIGWFKTLPLWLELPGLRVVHACWHSGYMACLAPRLEPGRRLGPDLLTAACRAGSPEYRAIETILKGPEVRLPAGAHFRIDGELRSAARTRWWDTEASTLRQAAIIDRPKASPEVRPGYDGDRPVFIGHYWMRGRPIPLTSRVACVDYSAGRGEPLVAYRWDGEKDIDASHFVTSADRV